MLEHSDSVYLKIKDARNPRKLRLRGPETLYNKTKKSWSKNKRLKRIHTTLAVKGGHAGTGAAAIIE